MSKTMEGREVSEEEAAKGLGFYNVAAFHRWKALKEITKQEPDRLLSDVCNLIEMLRVLHQQVERLENRLSDTGMERIG